METIMLNTNDCSVKHDADYLTQFILRFIIVGLALLSSLFIALTCLFSGKRHFWPFKLAIAQCVAECIDLIGALSLTYNSYCYQNICSWIGYIMHASWITSFLCSATITFMHGKTIQLGSEYHKWCKRLNKLIVLYYTLPYIILLTPFLMHKFGPTGWELYKKEGGETKFLIFCGFTGETVDKNVYDMWIFFGFWMLPLFIIFGLVCRFRGRNKQQVNELKSTGYEYEELDYIKGVQSFPLVYSFAWGINAIIRFGEYFQPISTVISNHLSLYIIIVILNLGFELHICLILYLFIKNYRKIINIKKIWFKILTCGKYTGGNSNSGSLIIEELNPGEIY